VFLFGFESGGFFNGVSKQRLQFVFLAAANMQPLLLQLNG
jgi:hypothetical protein